MATSGSFNSNTVGSFYVTVSWNRTGYNATKNEHYINYSVVAHNTAGKYRTVYIKELTINGNKVYNAPSGNQYYNNNTITGGTITIPSSNSAGDGSISISFRAGVGTSQSYNLSGSGTWNLDRIPRYATVTQSLASKTETSITMNWKTDSEIDILWFSTDGGTTWAWINATGTTGTYTIERTTGDISEHIKENTTYSILTRVRRKDSGLNSQTSALSVTTYNYPYCTSTPNFTIGDTLTLPLYNPLNRNVQVYILSYDEHKSSATTSKTSISGFNDTTWQNWFYARIPNARSGTYKAVVYYTDEAGLTHLRPSSTSGTYSVNVANCQPTIGSVIYLDSNGSSVAITGADSIIVQYMSNLYFNFNGLVAKNYASITGIQVNINGTTKYGTITGSGLTASIDFGEINVSGDVNAIIQLTDSRQITTVMNKTVNVTEYTIPNAIINLSRKSNFYEESYIKVNAVYSQIGYNTINIRYCMKKSSEDDSQYTSWVNLSDNVQATFNADNNTDWNIWVQLYDTFLTTIGSPEGGNAVNYHLILPRGIPIIFFDRFNNSTSFNCFPDRENAVLSTGLPLDDVVLIGSQVIIDSFTQSSAGTGVIAKCFNYDIIQGIFDGVYIPPSYERAYRIIVNIASTGDNNYGYITLNNIQTRPVRTMTNNYWKSKKLSSSRIFKESEITMQNVSILGQTTFKGLQLSAVADSGKCEYYNITIQGYLVKQSTDLSEVTPDVPTTLENTAILTVHRIVCDYMVANYGYADAQAVDNAFAFTYIGTSYQGSTTTPIFEVELRQSGTLKYTLTLNVVSEIVTGIVVN